jgi:hypothetical protein
MFSEWHDKQFQSLPYTGSEREQPQSWLSRHTSDPGFGQQNNKHKSDSGKVFYFIFISLPK